MGRAPSKENSESFWNEFWSASFSEEDAFVALQETGVRRWKARNPSTLKLLIQATAEKLKDRSAPPNSSECPQHVTLRLEKYGAKGWGLL